jgi:hypothetical protein
MKVSVRGQNNVLSKKEIRHSVSFFGNILLGKRLSENVYVEVYNEPFDLNDMGFCNPFDFEERSPREFELLLNCRLSRPEQLLTIAHEMVHVKQFALNEFKVFDNYEYKWHGKKVRHPRKKHSHLPWEREAIASEPWLMHFYEQYGETHV